MVIWANFNYIKSPDLFTYYGDPSFEALRALSFFLRTFVFDQSGALSWPFPTTLMLDQSQLVEPETVANCFDKRAAAIWVESKEPVTVLCGGDIDSLAILASLLKTAPNRNKVLVHYTSASVARYPRMFKDILPTMGVTLVDRTGKDLISDDVIRYCDGRSGDDFQASYHGYLSKSVPGDLRYGELEPLIDHIAGLVPGRPEHKQAAKDGLYHWIAKQAFSIKTPWQLVLYIHRVCFTQTSSWAGILLEDDTVSAFNKRVPFYDSQVFSGATRYLAENREWPANETVGVKKYVFDYFADTYWFKTPGLNDIHTVIKPGKLTSRWLSDKGQDIGYRHFPVK